MFTDARDFEEFSMRPTFVFLPDEFFDRNCDYASISITDDNVNEAEQIFVIEISVDPELQDEITTSMNVSLGRIMDNDGEWYCMSIC